MAQIKERGIYNFATPRNGRIALPWHFRNELEHYGCLDTRPCYDNRPFRIYRWLYPDGCASNIFDDMELIRYSELDEFDPKSLEARMHPWEEKRRPVAGKPLFHSPADNRKYVDEMIDHIIDCNPKRDSVQVICPPYGGLPLVCVVYKGKVTIL